jgi:NitT/TauT family transport system substrate-binding protein
MTGSKSAIRGTLTGKSQGNSRANQIGTAAVLMVAVATAVLVPSCRKKTASPPKLVTLKVGHLPVTGHAKFFVAKEEKFFEQEGLDVQLAEFTNSADGLAALRAGQLDLGAFGTTAPLVHIAKGADLRIIGGVMGEDASIITTKEKAAEIKSVADLKGRKVATVRLATGDAVLRGALAKVGLDWKKDLEIFEVKNPPAVIEAVKSGQVDAGVVWGPHDLRAEEQGLVVVVRSKDLAPGHPCCRLTINQKDLESRGDLWEHFIRAILKAERFSKTNQEATIRDIVKYVKIDPLMAKKAFYSPYLDQSSDPNLVGIQDFWKTMKTSNFVESTAEIAPFVDGKNYLAALDSLAKEEPQEAYWKTLRSVYSSRN